MFTYIYNFEEKLSLVRKKKTIESDRKHVVVDKHGYMLIKRRYTKKRDNLLIQFLIISNFH